MLDKSGSTYESKLSVSAFAELMNIDACVAADELLQKFRELNGYEFKNKYLICIFKDVKGLDLKTVGVPFERSELFPESVNTEFVKVLGKNLLEMRVWERGSGETLACGTGACAVAVAATLCGYCEKGEDITVRLLGGDLTINYTDERVLMTGPAVTVYEGIID